jgi:hypothetical protein
MLADGLKRAQRIKGQPPPVYRTLVLNFPRLSRSQIDLPAL